MTQESNPQALERSISWMRRTLFGTGGVFIVVGIVRQWPILGKSYMEFIEGKGYLSLMMGLIMVVLGFSVRLLMGEEE
jgi:hypothetical protein